MWSAQENVVTFNTLKRLDWQGCITQGSIVTIPRILYKYQKFRLLATALISGNK